MDAIRTRWLDHVLFALALAVLMALAWPGVEAHAESDLAPSARELTALSPRALPVSPAPVRAGASCQANTPLVDPQRAGEQRAAMQRLAEAMGAEGVVPMNGRGYAYPKDVDPTVELMRIQAEASSARSPR